MAPVINADDEEIAVSLATVFSLNAAALLLFPPLGHLFGLSERQFGLWAALAIHDTSSVVGATTAFGMSALVIQGRVGNRYHPAPPHQTVRAVFPHTAFRCSSLQNMRFCPTR